MRCLSIADAAVATGIPCLFVDSYFVTYDYLAALRKLCRAISCRLVYIDDVPAFPYPVDDLINYNIYGPDKKGNMSECIV